MIHNILTIVWALAQSPLVVFFGLIAVLVVGTCVIVRALRLQEIWS